MKSPSLINKVAIVTGGGGGIGAEIAYLLGHNGASIALFDLHDDALEVVGDRLESAAIQVMKTKVDVSNANEVLEAMNEVERRFGQLNVLVNVAGGGKPTTIAGTSSRDWDDAIGVNLTGPFNCIKHSAGGMRRSGGGAIVTVASLASLTMSMNLGASYTAAKAGVLGLTRHAAFELARDKIRVNAVLPGPVLTNLVRNHGSEEVLGSVPRIVPLGRWIRPEEVADATMFFCSDMSSGCTGTHLVVDGGLHIGSPSDKEAYFRSRSDVEKA